MVPCDAANKNVDTIPLKSRSCKTIMCCPSQIDHLADKGALSENLPDTIISGQGLEEKCGGRPTAPVSSRENGYVVS